MSAQTLQKEVELLKRALNPSSHRINVNFAFGGKDKPHGVYGNRIVSITLFRGTETQDQYAVSVEDELNRYSQEEYNDLVKRKPHMKTEPNHVWGTYEKWLESHRCKCGKHGLDNKQPYGEVYK